MSLTAKDLQQIRGIGEVLSLRLLEAGHDSFAKVVKLGDSGLRNIKGLNPKAIPEILEQAGRLAVNDYSERENRLAAFKDSVQGLRLSVQDLTKAAKERFSEKLSGKPGKKLTKTVVRFIEALESLEDKAGKKLKQSGKVARKTEQQLEGLAEAGLKELRNGLKKAGKRLRRVNA